MAEEIGRLLFVYALQNAVKHNDLPKAGTVISAVLGAHPELRSSAGEMGATMKKVLADVARLTTEERKDRLRELAPDLLADLSHPREHRKGLPALEGAENGVVMRFAPNPSGPLHLGHARAAVLNDAYVRQYGGKYILRIEDTDPKRVDPEAYLMVQEDIAWLGLNITDIIYQSDRLDTYYEYAEKLIAMGGAYVCTCENEQFRELKLKKTSCPCRALEIEENLSLWQKMLEDGFYEGEATVRVKTDLRHPDPAMRDFPAFRVLHTPIHPRVDAHVYPLMNFSVAVDDHLTGVTHVIRGKDHIANTRRQRYVFDYFGWKVPFYRHYGRMGIEGVVLSTSQMREGIRAGAYSGWDDIRLGTLRALARRGIQPEAVRQVVIEIGIGDTDISFSWENLYAKNRAIMDPLACRWFFVPDPVKVRVAGAEPKIAKAMLHPSDEKRGYRRLPFREEIYLPREELVKGQSLIRCKDLFNIDPSGWESGTVCYMSESLSDARAKKAPIVQWLPVEDAAPCVLHTHESDISGFCEPGVRREAGYVIQFERVGFVRIDSVSDDGIVAYFTHR
jgi:glutamyl-tRNA synthetase